MKKEDDYGFIIKNWMITALGLKGNTLIVYALIYDQCQFFGSCSMTQKELSANTGVKIPTIAQILKRLCKKGLLKKEPYKYMNFTYYSYSINEKENGAL